MRLLLALLIMLDSKGPAFFTRRRVGKGKKLFLICKYRTMRLSAPWDVPTHLLPSALTRRGIVEGGQSDKRGEKL